MWVWLKKKTQRRARAGAVSKMESGKREAWCLCKKRQKAPPCNKHQTAKKRKTEFRWMEGGWWWKEEKRVFSLILV